MKYFGLDVRPDLSLQCDERDLRAQRADSLLQLQFSRYRKTLAMGDILSNVQVFLEKIMGGSIERSIAVLQFRLANQSVRKPIEKTRVRTMSLVTVIA